MSSWRFSSIIERAIYENGTDKLPTNDFRNYISSMQSIINTKTQINKKIMKKKRKKEKVKEK